MRIIFLNEKDNLSRMPESACNVLEAQSLKKEIPELDSSPLERTLESDAAPLPSSVSIHGRGENSGAGEAGFSIQQTLRPTWSFLTEVQRMEVVPQGK